VTVDDAVGRFPLKSSPACYGGEGGGIESYEEWIKERIAALPIPDLANETKELVKEGVSITVNAAGVDGRALDDEKDEIEELSQQMEKSVVA